MERLNIDWRFLGIVLLGMVVGCADHEEVADLDQATVDAEELLLAVGRLHEERSGASTGGQVAFSCTYCHGNHGDNQSGFYPRLAGLPAVYLKNQLIAYQEGRRDSLSMQSMAIALTAAEVELVAEHFAAQIPTLPNVFQASAEKTAAGRAAAAVCVSCHGPEASGDPATPPLAGQGYDYLVSQLRAYRAGQRLDNDGVMAALAAGLSDDDIDALAHYYASL